MLGLLSPSTAFSDTVQQPDPQLIWIHQLEKCEDPTGNPDIKVLDTNDKYSYGVLQFQMSTWLQYQSAGTTEQNITDPFLQEKIARIILDAGGWKNWYICGKRAASVLGNYKAPYGALS